MLSVRCLHLGTFRFKGSDLVDMVWVTSASLAARHSHMPREEPKGKGRRVTERSGMADAALASLPDILPGLRQTFIEEVKLTVAAAAGGANDSGGSGTDKEDPSSEYMAWLSRELTRRRRFGGPTGGPLVYTRTGGGALGVSAGVGLGSGSGGGAGGGIGAPVASALQ